MRLPITGLARYELRRFRGVLPTLALAFVVCVPLLYGAIYLTASWDPYGRTDQLPVAVVNHDAGATYDDEDISAGTDLVASLHEDASFDWTETDPADAADGLAEGDYFMTLTIPEDFSENLISGAGDDPRRAQIDLRRNDANGFVVGSITASAENAIGMSVDESAIDSYFRAVFANLAEIRQGMSEARDGASDLADGLDEAHDGATELDDGASDAHAGSIEVADGAQALADGASEAEEGADDLELGLTELKEGSEDLSSGADELAEGTQTAADAILPALDAVIEDLPTIQDDAETLSGAAVVITQGGADATSTISTDLDTAAADLADLAQEYPDLVDDPTFQALQDNVDDLAERSTEVEESAQEVADAAGRIDEAVTGADGLTDVVQGARDDIAELNEGAQDLAEGAADLDEGIGQAQDGASTLADGVTDLATGADDLSAGAGTLRDGLSTLSDGTGDLVEGTEELSAGAGELRDGLSEGVDRIPALSQDQEEQAVQVLSSPADVSMTVDNAAEYYGRGLAPMFFAIALWVVGIPIFLVVRPISGRLLSARANPLRLTLTAWLPVAGITVAGGLLMIAAVWLFLGLRPENPAGLIGLTVVGAICFSAIAHLLRIALNTVASAVTLVLLIVQLPAAGGTFPPQLLQPFFAAIGPFLPMTYLIDGYRVVISGGLTEHLIRDVAVLGGIAVVALALCTVVVAKRQQFRVRDLHPPLVTP